MKPTLYLMVGLPCSGKTTRAKELEQSERALLLSPDAWQQKLFGGEFEPGERHDALHTSIEQIMWDVAERALSLGVSVILDFGFWAREEREEFRVRARRLGVGFRIHYMDVPKEELFRRLERRNADPGKGSFAIPPECLEEWSQLFEPPDAEELAANW